MKKPIPTSNATIQDIKKIMIEIKASDLSIDEKIIALTAAKAELIISMKKQGHKFGMPC